MHVSLERAEFASPSAPCDTGVGEPERVARLLGTLSLFEGAVPLDSAAAFAGATVQSVPAGTLLFDAGQAAETLYVILGGRVRLMLGPDPGSRSLAVLGRGDTIGLAALMRGDRYPVAATVLEDASLVGLPSACVQRLMVEYPVIGARLVGDMAAKLARFVTEIGGFTQRSARARVARLLLDLHRSAASDADRQSGIAFVELKRAIASRLAMTPETLSRELHALSGEGLIESRRTRFRVLDEDGLERSAEDAASAIGVR
jgi:CRP-like cAMP-binding protein